MQNGLDTKVEKSRKQMKERKNRAKKIRGVKKTKASDAAKKKWAIGDSSVVSKPIFCDGVSIIVFFFFGLVPEMKSSVLWILVPLDV